jgi:hypothetical protein
MGQGPESRADVEFLNCRFRRVCSVWSGVVMLKNHSMSSTPAFLLDCFLQMAKLLTIAFSSEDQVPLKQFIMDNPHHSLPDAKHCLARSQVSLMSKLPCLKRANHLWAVLSAIVFSIDFTSVSGGLNLTLYSFGPENFVTLVQIVKFQRRLIEENQSCEFIYYI